jgi:succinate-semialdehyde dehydrogenase/glutarate-semialdehyde dehydrogenase
VSHVTEAELLDHVPNQLFINGEWMPASGGHTLTVQDPATGKTIKTIADASVEDGTAALDAAVAAQDSWAATPPRVRGELLRRSFDLLQERKQEFALLMTLEMGKPLAEAYGEVAYGGEFLRWFSEEAVRITGRYGTNPEGTGRMIVSQHPVGPSFLITPWNFPLAMATRKIAPALAAGCTVVIKPAALTPLTTLYLVKLFEEAGLPAGVVNVITTSRSSAVSGSIIADPRLRKLSFTGSTAVGQQLIQQSAQGILRTSMELGGNAPFVVFEDADLDKAVDGAIAAKFRNIGQACTAANRFIVHESIADEFARRVTERVNGFTIGRGTEDGVTIGPLIDEKAVAKATALVRDAVKKGATLLTGGSAIDGVGTFYQPTVISGVKSGSDILREEIFGPVLSITPFTDEDDAVRIANDTEYGLVSYVYTRDLARGQRMIDRLQTGMMGLNLGVISNAAAPFGGVKQSGLGREGGFEGIHEYLSTKYTLTPDPFSSNPRHAAAGSGRRPLLPVHNSSNLFRPSVASACFHGSASGTEANWRSYAHLCATGAGAGPGNRVGGAPRLCGCPLSKSATSATRGWQTMRMRRMSRSRRRAAASTACTSPSPRSSWSGPCGLGIAPVPCSRSATRSTRRVRCSARGPSTCRCSSVRGSFSLS